jgi:2-oxoglutarate ferredoxin oxidoreductase subunit gamma
MMEQEIRLSGTGGQGLILGGIILAEAAMIDGKEVTQSQSYGPEARGGASKAEVIISDDEIDFPKFQECDCLLSLSQTACDKYLQSVKTNGILIVDETVKDVNRDDIIVIRLPLLNTAKEQLGRMIVANIVSITAMNEICHYVSDEALKKAIQNRVPKEALALNVAAFDAGKELAMKFAG